MRSEILRMYGTSMREYWGISCLPGLLIGDWPLWEGHGRTPGMHGHGRSYHLLVPTSPLNNSLGGGGGQGKGGESSGTRLSADATDGGARSSVVLLAVWARWAGAGDCRGVDRSSPQPEPVRRRTRGRNPVR
ncbi:MAG: hypothetical protein ACYDEY_12735 [Acidimicrobiales bacterium]